MVFATWIRHRWQMRARKCVTGESARRAKGLSDWTAQKVAKRHVQRSDQGSTAAGTMTSLTQSRHGLTYGMTASSFFLINRRAEVLN